jgi:hypothetical protein
MKLQKFRYCRIELCSRFRSAALLHAWPTKHLEATANLLFCSSVMGPLVNALPPCHPVCKRAASEPAFAAIYF